MQNTLIDAGMFGLAAGLGTTFAQNLWNDPIKRNYIMLFTVGVILLWIVLLNGPKKLL